jgi:NADH-quinone oxidoreductase subunit I
MYGVGILKGLGVTFKHFVDTFVDDVRWLGRRRDLDTFQHKQSLANRGMVTVEYPDEKLAVPERFRFVPFLVTYNHDDPEYPGKDWCTSCGICAKVCPPQCIWIVRGTNPETGRPKPEPEQFYIDIDICMNCGYCAEYCPFDAIKMDHDYELASYDRTSNHIYDLHRLSKEIRYWESIAPTIAAEELVARGGYDHTDVQKSRKKAGLPASRPGPVSDKPEATPAPAAAAPAAAPVAPAPAAPAPAAPTSAAPAAAPGAATTPEGIPIVRRRGGPPKSREEREKERAERAASGGAAPAAPTARAATPPAPPRPAPSAPPAPPKQEAAPAQTPPPTAADTPLQGGLIQRGPKRVIDPNNPPPVVRRRNPPPNKG